MPIMIMREIMREIAILVHLKTPYVVMIDG
jgi:hypothetical protein